MAGIEMLALISGSAYHNKKDVCLTFSSDLLKRRKFQKGVQRETAVGVYPSCIYTWHRCAPSYGGVRFVLSYIPAWRRHLLLLILDTKGFPTTSIDKDNEGNMIPAPFLCICGS